MCFICLLFAVYNKLYTYRQGVICNVEHWTVSEVASWLRSTNDGQFEQYVTVFEKHKIYGDALLSLDNEILRDEMCITAYGIRYALLKSISNLNQSYIAWKKKQQNQKKTLPIKVLQRQRLQISSHQSPHFNFSHHKSSESSCGSKLSATYHQGDITHNTTFFDDTNWENLPTLKNHNLIDPSEYVKKVKCTFHFRKVLI